MERAREFDQPLPYRENEKPKKTDQENDQIHPEGANDGKDHRMAIVKPNEARLVYLFY